MSSILIRTVLIYAFLILVMRLMGKRQIGELEVTDLVTTFLLSEIASLPITDPGIPVLHAIVPIVTLLAIEVFSSYILLRFPRLKSIFAARPAILIDRGRLDTKLLMETRLSPDELMCEIRGAGLSSIEQVYYAILEKNGKVTILPRSAFTPPLPSDLEIQLPPETQLTHIVYHSGVVSDNGLSLIGRDRNWLSTQFRKKKIDPATVFFATADESGNLCCFFRPERRNH